MLMQGVKTSSGGIYVTPNKIICDSMQENSFSVSVSIDGSTASNSLNRTLYEGSCVACDQSGCANKVVVYAGRFHICHVFTTIF